MIYIIFLALLLLTSFPDARLIEKMSIYENTAPKLHVNHFDCSKMISNQMYSLNKVVPCETRPDKISTNQARVTLYQRNYKVKLEETMCKATQQQLRWFCDSFDSSGIDARHNTITTSVKLDAQNCKLAKERKKQSFPLLLIQWNSILTNLCSQILTQAMLELETMNVTPEVGLHTTLMKHICKMLA